MNSSISRPTTNIEPNVAGTILTIELEDEEDELSATGLEKSKKETRISLRGIFRKGYMHVNLRY